MYVSLVLSNFSNTSKLNLGFCHCFLPTLSPCFLLKSRFLIPVAQMPHSQYPYWRIEERNKAMIEVRGHEELLGGV